MTDPAPEAPPGSAAVPRGPAITREEELGPGIRRICLEYLDRACAALAQPGPVGPEGIHTARKSIKRVRAMLRLLRDTRGEGAYREEDDELQAAARGLAGARDRAVLAFTLDRLADRHRESLPPGAFAGLRGRWREEGSAGAEPAALPAEVMGTLAALRDSRRRWASWSPDGPPAVDGFPAIAGGLGRTYRQGRDRMMDAYRRGEAPGFHLWRKSAKYLRYQLEALQGAWPEVLGSLAEATDRLAETLGDEHDFTLLRGAVEADPQLVPDEAERRLLLALAAEEQDRLRAAAAPLGERVYAEPPGAFTRRIGAYWAASRR